jgi:predicted anti-sigma-YlaC factor YlaD
MMTCKDVLQRLSDIVDGESPLLTRCSFYIHIAMCKNCRKYFQQFRDIHEATQHVEPEDLNEEFFDIMNSVLQSKPDSSSEK